MAANNSVHSKSLAMLLCLKSVLVFLSETVFTVLKWLFDINDIARICAANLDRKGLLIPAVLN